MIASLDFLILCLAFTAFVAATYAPPRARREAETYRGARRNQVRS
jgi:hypothetical protein